jgi:N-acetylmuramoyl-L-alanine amidase
MFFWLRLAPGVVAGGTLAMLAVPSAGWAQSARTRYESALAREPQVRSLIESTSASAAAGDRARVDREVRRLVASYEALVGRYPTSGYSDNALWQAAELHRAQFERQGRDQNRAAALRLYRRLIREYPASSLVKKSESVLISLEAARPAVARAPPPAPAPSPPAPPPAAVRAPDPPPAERTSFVAPEALEDASKATLMSVQRTVLSEAVRVTLTLDREVPYHEERITGPERVFLDLRGVSLPPSLLDRTFDYEADVVRQVRLGRHPNATVRVVLDVEGVTRHSVFTLYNPFRLIIDCERPAASAAAFPPPVVVERPPAADAREEEPVAPARTPVPSRNTAPPPSPSPSTPAANAAGGFSIARQLGLGVSRIVIDPGHGGRDPGAMVRGLTEADLTLDVALRLEKLLQQEAGIEVVLTRRTDVYVPLEERTAIANRESADLFLSIHANASRNPSARGVETYYLSFASSAEAEAVAARENAGSEGVMRNLPDIIKAIALNNKLDESRDFAGMVQQSLVSRLRRVNSGIRDLGVKKAPFVVLIGAGMPSVLAEISFLTHRQDAQLLKTANYRQRIAEALQSAVIRYRQSLKGQTVAER